MVSGVTVTSGLVDWISLVLRWAHVMAGIMWIGTSFYFIWLDASLRRRAGMDERLAGESWMVHGGGFYRVGKFTVAPDSLPDELHWFKYEAYLTWATGFLLLAVIYYWGAAAFLIRPDGIVASPALAIAISVASLIVGWVAYDLLCKSRLGRDAGTLAVALFVLIALASFGYAQVFPGRAAFLHIGAFIGTIMAANVAHVIIPNQRKAVAELVAGRSPDPALGLQAKQRSLHNNYLTLPVVFMMVSNHYPIAYGHAYGWLVALGVVVAGGLVRHFFNSHDAGRLTTAAKLALPAAALLIALLAVATAWRPAPPATAAGEVTFAQVHPVVRQRCATCHSARPSDPNFTEAPGGVIFDTARDIRTHADRIAAQAVHSDAMPLANQTGMTEDERRLLGAWIAAGAKIE